MADNKEYLMKTVENGNIYISEEVICTIAALAAMEVEGVEAVSGNIGADIAEILGVRNFAKALKIAVEEDSVSFDCSIVIAYGYDVVAVAKELQNAVSSAVSSMTGLSVSRVDVNVSGVSISKKTKS